MEQQRIGGQYLAIDVDMGMEASSKFGVKDLALRDLGSRVHEQFPDCAGCKNLELIENVDHLRYMRKFAVTCKNRPSHSGAVITCPDGMMGRLDEEKKFMAIPKPTVIWPADLDEYTRAPARPEDFFATPSFKEDERAKIMTLMKQSMIRDSEFSGEGVSKIAAGLAKFGPGSTTGYNHSDARINPQIPNDNTSFLTPKKPVNRDLPQTADDGAW